MSGAAAAEVEEAQRCQLLLQRPIVLGNDFGRHRLAAVVDQEQRLRQIVHVAVQTWLRVESAGVRNTALDEDRFVLFAGVATSWPDANADASFVAHGRQHRRPHGNHSGLALARYDLLDRDGRQGLDVSVVTQAAEVTEQLVAYFQPANLSGLADSHNPAARRPLIRPGLRT